MIRVIEICPFNLAPPHGKFEFRKSTCSLDNTIWSTPSELLPRCLLSNPLQVFSFIHPFFLFHSLIDCILLIYSLTLYCLFSPSIFTSSASYTFIHLSSFWSDITVLSVSWCDVIQISRAFPKLVLCISHIISIKNTCHQFHLSMRFIIWNHGISSNNIIQCCPALVLDDNPNQDLLLKISIILYVSARRTRII